MHDSSGLSLYFHIHPRPIRWVRNKCNKLNQWLRGLVFFFFFVLFYKSEYSQHIAWERVSYFIWTRGCAVVSLEHCMIDSSIRSFPKSPSWPRHEQSFMQLGVEHLMSCPIITAKSSEKYLIHLSGSSTVPLQITAHLKWMQEKKSLALFMFCFPPG